MTCPNPATSFSSGDVDDLSQAAAELGVAFWPSGRWFPETIYIATWLSGSHVTLGTVFSCPHATWLTRPSTANNPRTHVNEIRRRGIHTRVLCTSAGDGFNNLPGLSSESYRLSTVAVEGYFTGSSQVPLYCVRACNTQRHLVYAASEPPSLRHLAILATGAPSFSKIIIQLRGPTLTCEHPRHAFLRPTSGSIEDE